jgi:hypothetical protein
MATTTTRDPDGFGCYSDHAEDIRTKGACDLCTSTDPDVVGHVLPDVTRYTGKDPVEAAQLVRDRKSVAFFDGILLDGFTASAINAVYDALGDEAKAHLRGLTLTKAATVCFKLTAR